MTRDDQPTNRLIDETSPYLLQHAHNPIDWHPWGDEAIAKARDEDKPIFLSVGYSACHWCHVMERESFEDEEVADFVNAHFIAIKVDREERPDVDDLYMNAVQLMTGQGGWPMSVWLDTDLKPFYAGTYFPPEDRYGRPGFMTIMRELHRVWTEERERIDETTDEIVARLEAMGSMRGEDDLDDAPLAGALQWHARRFDDIHGGFGDAPKFPHSAQLEALLAASDDPSHGDLAAKGVEMATVTLSRMAAGGMYDQVGGGFHRYSVDQRWLIPHFEKMLYDNAQLAATYTDAFQRTDDPTFARIARETLDYLLREMVEEGLDHDTWRPFWSTTDADSEGEEGKFFVWTPDQLKEVLGEEEGAAAAAYWGVTEKGNFEHGASALHRLHHLNEHGHHALEEELPEEVTRWREQLYEARQERVPPATDTKVITAWNGLAIRALARAGFVLDEPRYVSAAEAAARFFTEKMILAQEDGSERLMRIFKDDRVRFAGYLDDHAYLLEGLLGLFGATAEAHWLEQAQRVAQMMRAQFGDGDGLFTTTAEHHESILVRQTDAFDGATPAGNTTALRGLLRLSVLTEDHDLRQQVVRGLERLMPKLQAHHHGLPVALHALRMHLRGPQEVVIVTPSGGDAGEPPPMVAAARRAYAPNAVTLIVREDRVEDLQTHVPWLEGRGCRDGAATAYVCREGACKMPTTDVAVFSDQLSSGAS